MPTLRSLRIRRLAPVMLTAVALVALPARAWGPAGHQAVGAIADRLLAGTPTAAALRAWLQPGETLASIANWADCAKGPRVCNAELTVEMRAFVEAHPEHREYHYTDVSIAQGAYQRGLPGTSPHDIVQVLAQCAAALGGNRDPARNPIGLTPRQGLLLAAHLLGDLHQPLHVGAVYLDEQGRPVDPANETEAKAASSDGGNKLHLDEDEARVLHAYWDFDVATAALALAGATSVAGFAETSLAGDAAPENVTDPVAAVDAWATESLGRSRGALQTLTYSPRRTYAARNGQPVDGWNVRLPPGQSKQDAASARAALVLGGKRLAGWLTAVLSTPSSS